MAKTHGAHSLGAPDVNARARRNQAVKLRIMGLSQREIAERVGVSQPQVSRMIRQALREEQAENVDELRAIELHRMEAVHAAMTPHLLKGDARAAGAIVRASERRSRLMRLDETDSIGAGAVLVSVWVEAITLDREEDLATLLATAERLGIEAARAQPAVIAAGGEIVATQTQILNFATITASPLRPESAEAMIQDARRGTGWGPL